MKGKEATKNRVTAYLLCMFQKEAFSSSQLAIFPFTSYEGTPMRQTLLIAHVEKTCHSDQHYW